MLTCFLSCFTRGCGLRFVGRRRCRFRSAGARVCGPCRVRYRTFAVRGGAAIRCGRYRFRRWRRCRREPTTCARCCVGVVVCRMRRCLFRGFRGPRATRHIAIFSRPWMWLRRSARWVCGLSAAALRLVLRWAASVCAGARPGVMTGARAFAWRLPLPAIRGLRLGSCGSGRRTARRRRRCRCSRACRSRARRSRGMPRFAGAPYARPSATAAAPVRLPSRPTDRAQWPTSPNRFAAIRETFAENRLQAIETAKYGVLRIALRRCAGTVEMLSIFRQTRGGARCSDSDRKR